MALVGDVREAILEAGEDLVEEVAERREFRQAFLDPDDCGNASDCALFRMNIIMLVEDLGTLSNALFIATGLDTRIETTRLTTILGRVPGRALYPLYRGFSEELNLFESNFVNTLSFAADNIDALEDAVVSEGCDLILDNNNFPIPIEDAIRGTKITGSGMELVGGIFEAISTKSVTKEGAIWGWVGGNFQNNRLKNIGVKFTTAGKVLGKYANIVSTKLLRCTIKDDNQQIMAALGAFDPDVTNLDVAVSSRSSQESVDGIQASVASLETDISTRASQASVEGLGTSVAELIISIANRSSQASVDALAVTMGNLDVTNLDAAVSTRASQSSVDALAATLGNLDTGNLDASVSTRASQVSVNTRASQTSVDGLGTGIMWLTGTVTSRSSQTSVNDLATTLAGLDVSGLDVDVSTRASQASVDTLSVLVGSHDTGNLDDAVSTRASQASLDNLGGVIENNNSMALRVQIEQQLSNNKKGISTYYLPEAYGGLLELVRDIVGDTLMQNAAAGIPLRKAKDHFQDGELALSISDYKEAFDKYQKAYREVTK
jgi:hypothetical protein